jgi:hypothetical protein
MQESLRIFEVAEEIKLRRDRGLESSKEGRGSKSTHRNQAQRKDAKLFGQESLRT